MPTRKITPFMPEPIGNKQLMVAKTAKKIPGMNEQPGPNVMMIASTANRTPVTYEQPGPDVLTSEIHARHVANANRMIQGGRNPK